MLSLSLHLCSRFRNFSFLFMHFYTRIWLLWEMAQCPTFWWFLNSNWDSKLSLPPNHMSSFRDFLAIGKGQQNGSLLLFRSFSYHQSLMLIAAKLPYYVLTSWMSQLTRSPDTKLSLEFMVRTQHIHGNQPAYWSLDMVNFDKGDILIHFCLSWC